MVGRRFDKTENACMVGNFVCRIDLLKILQCYNYLLYQESTRDPSLGAMCMFSKSFGLFLQSTNHTCWTLHSGKIIDFLIWPLLFLFQKNIFISQNIFLVKKRDSLSNNVYCLVACALDFTFQLVWRLNRKAELKQN